MFGILWSAECIASASIQGFGIEYRTVGTNVQKKLSATEKQFISTQTKESTNTHTHQQAFSLQFLKVMEGFCVASLDRICDGADIGRLEMSPQF